MDEEKTYALRYVGRRFAGARLPLDVLSDLPALRDLIAALAKQEFRQRNPDRKRVPQGFDRSISFALVDIRDGSAAPTFVLDREVAQQHLPNIGDGMEEIVDRAFGRIAKIFDDVGQDRFPHALPLDAISALSKLGANIRNNERIELTGTIGTDGAVVSLDSYRRKALLTHVRETYTVEVEDVGTLTGIDATHNIIQINTDRFGEIRLPLHEAGITAEQFDGNLHTLVEFSISVALDAHDDLRGIEEVHAVDLVRPYDEDVTRCIARLHALSRLERGWLGDDHGERVVHLAGTRATQLIFMRASLAKLFRIFPTEDGGVSIEFDLDDWSFGVEIAPDGAIEVDGSSTDGSIYTARRFPEFSHEFFEAFDTMMPSRTNE
jgi:hypothetical protein